MTLLRQREVRVLDDRDLPAALAVVARDPIMNVFVGARLESIGLDPKRLGAEVWGFGEDGLESLCYTGANMVPVECSIRAATRFGERAARQGRFCSSIVGAVNAVEAMWQVLEPHWGPAREVRSPQPLLAINSDPWVPGDPDVRQVQPDEIELLLPACVAMFTEEVGVSPIGPDGGALYRSRVAELVTQGRAFARIDDGRIVFKAEVGAVSDEACQVQGVWVPPELRGGGLGTTGTAAVVRLARAELAPIVSLYVNAYNAPARQAYERVGFREIGAVASVLF